MFLLSKYRFSYSFFLVEMPNGRYKGQKLIELVSIKMADKTRPMIASVPVITCVKYKVSIAKATSILVSLSAVPILFFMIFLIAMILLPLKKNNNQCKFYN